MEQWLPALIAAILGGTGIASLLTGGAQLTARARIKHRLEVLKFARSVSKDANTLTELARAIEHESLRLSSLSTVRLSFKWIHLAGAVSLLAFSAVLILLQNLPSDAFNDFWSLHPSEITYPLQTATLSILASLVFAPWVFLYGINLGRRAAWLAKRIADYDGTVTSEHAEDDSETTRDRER